MLINPWRSIGSKYIFSLIQSKSFIFILPIRRRNKIIYLELVGSSFGLTLLIWFSIFLDTGELGSVIWKLGSWYGNPSFVSIDIYESIKGKLSFFLFFLLIFFPDKGLIWSVSALFSSVGSLIENVSSLLVCGVIWIAGTFSFSSFVWIKEIGSKPCKVSS